MHFLFKSIMPVGAVLADMIISILKLFHPVDIAFLGMFISVWFLRYLTRDRDQ